MQLICYEKNGLKCYKECESLEEFTSSLPDIKPTYVFDITDEIAYNMSLSMDNFCTHCNNYGFSPSDFNRSIVDKRRNKTYVLKGFRPRNRKYKCIVYCPETRQTYKMSPNYIHEIMRYANA